MTEYPACFTCYYYDKPRCRRNPPVTYNGDWPNIPDDKTDWCGEHRLKEGPSAKVDPDPVPEVIELAPPVPGPDPVSLPFAQAPTGKKKRT